FALILPSADAASALGVAERVRAAVHALGANGTSWSNAGIRISVSIGVATYPRDGMTTEEILLAADRACFVAKRTGHGLIATADEGLAIARDFSFKAPTPIDAVEVASPRTDAGGLSEMSHSAADDGAAPDAATPRRQRPHPAVDASPVS